MNQHNKVTSRHIPQPESPTIIEETPKSQLPTPTVGKIEESYPRPCLLNLGIMTDPVDIQQIILTQKQLDFIKN